MTVLPNHLFDDCYCLTAINVEAGNPSYKSVNGLLLSADGKTLIRVPVEYPPEDFELPEGVTGYADGAFAGTGITPPAATPTPSPKPTNPPTPAPTDTPTPAATSTPEPTPKPTAAQTVEPAKTPEPQWWDDTATEEPFPEVTPYTAAPTAEATPAAPSQPAASPDVSAAPDTHPTPEGGGTPTPEPAPPVQVPVGEYAITAGTVRLEIDGNATFLAPAKKSMKKLTIPATVRVNGVSYPITRIATGACRDMKKLTTLTIGKNVRSIGKRAFYGCKSLKSITIKTKRLTQKTVGAKAFKGISKKATVKVPKSVRKQYRKWLPGKGVPKTAKIK